jgi:hypothetical protein
MNKSNSEPTSTLLARILVILAKRGHEAELKRDQFCMDLILGHIQPLSPEIIGALRENGFNYNFLDKVTYTDTAGAIRYRSHFRRPH